MSLNQIIEILKSLPPEKQKEAEEFIEGLSQKNKAPQRKVLRPSGLAKGLIEMKDNFDEPLEDFKDYM